MDSYWHEGPQLQPSEDYPTVCPGNVLPQHSTGPILGPFWRLVDRNWRMRLGVCRLQRKGWSWNSNRGTEWPERAHSTRDWTAVRFIRYELVCDKLMVFMPLNFLTWFLFFCSCAQSIQQRYFWRNSIWNWSDDCFEYVLVRSCGCRISLRVTYFNLPVPFCSQSWSFL